MLVCGSVYEQKMNRPIAFSVATIIFLGWWNLLHAQNCDITVRNGAVAGSCGPIIQPPPPPPPPSPPPTGCPTSGTFPSYADPSSVLVIAQTNTGPESGTNGVDGSKFVADHYMACRKIPAGNIVYISSFVDSCGGPGCQNGNVPHGDSTNFGNTNPNGALAAFNAQIAAPVLAKINALIVQGIKIRYLVPVYGVPVTIAGVNLSVDSVLANLLLPAGSSFNPYASSGKHIDVSTSKVLLVSRLDGPSAAKSAALVDLAIQGEIQVVGGKGYFDYNVNAPFGYTTLAAYKNCVAKFGPSPCVLNDQNITGGFFISAPNTAWCWGGYAPYDPESTFAVYQFVPGAVCAQMNSNAASTIRRPTPGSASYMFLNNGVTATWGPTAEPYSFYAMGDVLLSNLWQGYTFGESAYLTVPLLSHVFVFVGDPLYRPKIQ